MQKDNDPNLKSKSTSKWLIKELKGFGVALSKSGPELAIKFRGHLLHLLVI